MLRFLLPLILFMFISSLYAKSTKNIAIIMDDYSPGYIQIQKDLQYELTKLLRRDYKISFPQRLQKNGHNNYFTTKNAIKSVMNDTNCQLVITVGIVSSDIAAHLGRLSHPTLATTIVDKQMQNVSYKHNGSQKKNLSYQLSFHPIQQSVKELTKLVPLKHVTIMTNRNLQKYSPDTTTYIKQLFNKEQISTTFLSLSPDYEGTVKLIEGHTDLVFVLPLLDLTSKQKKRFYAELNKRKFLSYSMQGLDDVKQGALFGSLPKDYNQRLVRQTAFQALQIFSGKQAARLDVDYYPIIDLSINIASSKKIGFLPGWNILSNAQLIQENYSSSPYLSMENIMTVSMLKNIDIQTQLYQQKAQRIQVDQAKAGIRPAVLFDVAGVINDEDRAKASLGTIPTNKVDASINVNYDIYDTRKWANITFQSLLSKSQTFKSHQLKLDVALQSALHFLQISKLKSRVKIEKGNLQLSQRNLQLSTFRQRIGIGSKSDSYRWENKIASDKQRLLFSHAALKNEQHALNAIMNLPQNKELNYKPITNRDPIFLTHRKEIFNFLKEPVKFVQLENYLVDLALNNVPHIQELKALQTARHTLVKSNKRALFLPVLSFQAGLTQHLSNELSGTKASQLVQTIQDPDDTDYSLLLKLRFPLYSGGYDSSTIEYSQANYLAAKSQIKRMKQVVEQNVRDALYLAKASYLAMQLAQDATVSAQKNLQQKESVYKQGNSDILHLLDAQETMLNSQLQLNQRKYHFMIDLIKLQYYIGQINFNISDTEWKNWMLALQKHN